MTRWTRLGDRGVLEVSGGDATKLLQGLVSNDLDQLAEAPALSAEPRSPPPADGARARAKSPRLHVVSCPGLLPRPVLPTARKLCHLRLVTFTLTTIVALLAAIHTLERSNDTSIPV